MQSKQFVEWEIDGKPATDMAITVFDERDPYMASYGHIPLCVAFALPIKAEGDSVDVRMRVVQPGVYVTISHALWS